MKRTLFLNPLLWIFIISTCLASCNSAKEEPKIAEVPPAPSVPVYPHEIPENDGLFARTDSGFAPIAAGDRAALMPTAAQNAFGFEQPSGTLISPGIQEFTLKSTPLRSAFVRVTKLKGAASRVQDVTAPVDRANVAWLPAEQVHASIETLDKASGLLDIHLEKPLSPGFYMIHDDSFVRSRHSDEVTAFYPLIVGENRTNVWTQDADKCFAQMKDVYGAGSSSSKENAAKTVQECIAFQRMAWKIVPENDEYRLRLLYLARLASPENETVHAQIASSASPQSSGTAGLLWQAIQNDIFSSFEAAWKQTADGRMPMHTDLKRITEAFGIPYDMQTLTALVWIPLTMLDENDPLKLAIFTDIIQEKPDALRILTALGALFVRRIQDEVQRFPAQNAWLKKTLPTIRKEFSAAASAMHPADAQPLTIGPFAFTNVPDEEQTAWRALFKAKRTDIESCLAGKAVRESTLLILEQPLSTAGIGPVTHGTLSDPAAESRSIPVIAPEAVACVLKIFSSLPGRPTILDAPSVKLAIAVKK